jgi:glutathione S-transferase
LFWPYVGPARFTPLETDEACEAAQAAGVRQVQQPLAALDAHYVSRNHFVGNYNTLADATSVPPLRWCKNIAASGLADAPDVGAYTARTGGDEGVRAAVMGWVSS